MRKIFLILIIACSLSLYSIIELCNDRNRIESYFSGISNEEHLAIYHNPAYVNILEFNRVNSNLQYYNKGIKSSSLVTHKTGDLNFYVYGELSEIKKWKTTPYPQNDYYDYYNYANIEEYYDNGTSTFDDDYQISNETNGIYYNTLNQFGDAIDFRIAIGKNKHGFLYKYNMSNSNFIPNGTQYELRVYETIEMGTSSPRESYHRISENINENLTEFTMHTLTWGIMSDLKANKTFDLALSIFHSSLTETSRSGECDEIDFDPDNDGNIVNNSFGWIDGYQLCRNYRSQLYEEYKFRGKGFGYGVYSRITIIKAEKIKFVLDGKYFFQKLNTTEFNYYRTRTREATCFRSEFNEVYLEEETYFLSFTNDVGYRMEIDFRDTQVTANIEYSPNKKLLFTGTFSVDVSLNREVLFTQSIDEDMDLDYDVDSYQYVKSVLSIPIGMDWNINKKFIFKGVVNSNVYLGTINSRYNYRRANGIAYIFLNYGLKYKFSDKIYLECVRLKELGFSNPIYGFSFGYSY